MKTETTISLTGAFASALLFAAATPLSKVLLADFDPVRLSGLLYLGAALGAAPLAMRERSRGSRPAMNRVNRLRLTGAILCGGVIGPICYLLGLRLASSTAVSLWLNLELVATAILGHFIFRDHLGRHAWLGIAVSIGAGLLLTSGEAAGIAAASLIALSCILWGIDNHLTALIDGITPAQSTFWKGLAAGSFNLAVSVVTTTTWPSIDRVLPALLVGAFSYGLSITLYISSAQKLGATRAQIIFATSPFIAAFLSHLLLSEPFGWSSVAAVGLLVLAVALILRDRNVHEHEHEHVAMSHEHSHRHDDGHHDHHHTGLAPSTRHTHWHSHDPHTHRHPHWPDLHHRHGHA